MAAGGSRDDEGGTTARCRSFLWKQVYVGERGRIKVWYKSSVGGYQKYPCHKKLEHFLHQLQVLGKYIKYPSESDTMIFIVSQYQI